MQVIGAKRLEGEICFGPDPAGFIGVTGDVAEQAGNAFHIAMAGEFDKIFAKFA